MFDYTNVAAQVAKDIVCDFGIRQLLDGVSRYTIGWWSQLKRNDSGGGGVYVEWDPLTASFEGLRIAFVGANGNQLIVGHGATVSTLSAGTVLDITYSYLLTYDSTDGLVIYRNGVSFHTDAGFTAAPVVANTVGLSIGADLSGVTPPLPGYLGNVAVWPNLQMNDVDALMWHDGIMPHYNSCKFFYRCLEWPGRDETIHTIPDCYFVDRIVSGHRLPIDFLNNIWLASDPSDNYYDLHGELPNEQMVILAGEELNRRRLIRKTFQITVPTEFYARELMEDLQITHKGGLEYSGEGFGYGDSPERLARIQGMALRLQDLDVDLSLRDMKRQAMSYYNSFRAPFNNIERQDGVFRLVPPHVAKSTTRDSFAWAPAVDNLYHEFGLNQEPTTYDGLLVESRGRNYFENPAFKYEETGWTLIDPGAGFASAGPLGSGLKILRPYVLDINDGWAITPGYTEVTATDPGDPLVHDDATSSVGIITGGAQADIGFRPDPSFGERMREITKVTMFARVKRTGSTGPDEFRFICDLGGDTTIGPWVPMDTSYFTHSYDITALRPGGGDFVEDDFRDYPNFAFICRRPTSGPTINITSMWMEIEYLSETGKPQLFHLSVTRFVGRMECGPTPASDYAGFQQDVGGVPSANMTLSFWHWDETGDKMSFSVERQSDGFYVQSLTGGWASTAEVFLDVDLAIDSPERFRLPFVLVVPGGGETYTITFYARNVAEQINWLYHAQLEEGDFATSPIVSETSNTYLRQGSVVVLRNPDNLMVPKEHGTIAFEFEPTWSNTESTGNKFIMQLYHDDNNFFRLYWSTAGSGFVYNLKYNGTHFYASVTPGSWDAGDTLMFGLRWLAAGELGKDNAQVQIFAKVGSGDWREGPAIELTEELQGVSESFLYLGSQKPVWVPEHDLADGLFRYLHIFPEALPFEEIKALLGEPA